MEYSTKLVILNKHPRTLEAVVKCNFMVDDIAFVYCEVQIVEWVFLKDINFIPGDFFCPEPIHY